MAKTEIGRGVCPFSFMSSSIGYPITVENMSLSQEGFCRRVMNPFALGFVLLNFMIGTPILREIIGVEGERL